MADHVVVSIVVLFVAFLVPYLFQWYRAYYYPEAEFDDLEMPAQGDEFEQPSVPMF